MDEKTERIFAQALGVARRLNDDGENRGPAFGRSEAGVLVAPLGPGDAEGIGRGANDARNVDGDLDLPDLGERIIGAGVVVESVRALVGDKIIGLEPVLADDDRIGRNGADILDEAREMPGDLRIGWLIVGDRRGDGLRFAESCRSAPPRERWSRARFARRAPMASPPARMRLPKAIRRQFFACTRAEPMRSSQTCAAFW